jgi:glucosamine--fructose-6-phosphate aminotransferase (isomerizing)
MDQMAREIAEGPDAVVATLLGCEAIRGRLDEVLAARRRVVVVATGASLAMARAAAPAWRRGLPQGVGLVIRQSTETALGGVDGWSFEASDLVVAVSQSGTSPETLAAADCARDAGVPVVAVTAHAESQLAERAVILVALRSGEERDASTKSALATLAALLALAGAIPTDEQYLGALDARLRSVVEDRSALDPAGRVMADARRSWFLAFGTGLGIAEAAQLLWHEKVARPATAATPSEFRHGLIEAFGPSDAVVLIDVDAAEPRRGAYLDRLRDEVSALRGAFVDVVPDLVQPPGSGRRNAISIDAPDDGAAALEATLRIQQLAHATAVLAGTYRDGFAVLRRTVLPASDIFESAGSVDVDPVVGAAD